MTVNRLRKDGDEQHEITCGERSENGYLAIVTETSHTADALKDEVAFQTENPDQAFSSKPSEGTCEGEDLKSLWSNQTSLSKTRTSTSCKSIASHLTAQERLSSSLGDQNSYVSLKSVKLRRRRANSEVHNTAKCFRVRRKNVRTPEPVPLVQEKSRISEPDTHGISESAVFFSPDIGGWRLLDLDLVTYELEQSRRTRLLRASARHYQEISESHLTCSIL